MTDYKLGGTSLTQLTEALADDDRFLVLNKSDTTTAPADANGSDQWIDAATAAKAFYRGALLVLPSASNVAATNATLVNSAITAAVSAGIGVVKLAPVAWNIACGTISHDGSGLTLDMAGVTVTASGSGDLIRMTDSSTYDDRVTQGGGITGMPVLDGSSTSGNACAVHAGDILQLALFFQAQNWTAGTTSKGLWLDNQNFWTEQAYGRIYLQNCKSHAVFDVSGTPAVTATGSFDRPALKIFVNQGAASQDGVTFQNGSYIDDIAALHIGGNFQTSSTTPTSAVLRITGQAGGSRPDAGVFSHLGNGKLSINAECGIVTGTQGPFTIVFGAAGNYISNPIGSMSFDANGPNFQSSNSAGSSQFVFTGPVTGDNNLVGTYVGALTTSLITIFGSSGSLGPAQVAADGNNLPFITNPNGLSGYIPGTQQAAVATIGNVTTETALAALTVPANDPVAGAVYHLHGFATTTISTTAPTITWRIRWGGAGGTVLAVTAAIAETVSSTGIWEFDGFVEFDSASTATARLKLTYNLAATSTAPGRQGAGTTALAVTTTAVTVTVSSAESLVLTAAFGGANSQSLTARGWAERVA